MLDNKAWYEAERGRRAEFKILEWKMNKQVVRRLVLPMSWTWVVLMELLAAVSVSCSVVSAESQIIEDSFIVSGSPKLVAETDNGSIIVSLAGTLGVEIDAATSNGQVSSLLPITIEGTAKDNELKGTIGGGGSALNIRTSNGSISIK